MARLFRSGILEIKLVYDHFHIDQNFNEKVINEVKKDEVKRLLEEGDVEAAKTLKGSKKKRQRPPITFPALFHSACCCSPAACWPFRMSDSHVSQCKCSVFLP